MCNEQSRQIALGQVRTDWGETRIPLRFPEGLPNMAPLDSIRITDSNVIIRPARDEAGAAELVTRRWSWPGPGGKPVYNYRSDGRAFRNSATGGRCLIVADGFYEFTTPQVPPGAPKPKRKHKWLFTKADESWFCIAGIWRTDPSVGEAYTMLTCEPGPDVAPFHGRQVVVIGRADWGRWLDPAVPAAELCRPLPAGSLEVVQVA